MALYDTLHYRQSNSSPSKISPSVEALEWLKKLISISHVESNAIVSNKKSLLSFMHDSAYFNLRFDGSANPGG